MRKLAAWSRSLTKGTNTSPARILSVNSARPSRSPRRERSLIHSPSCTPNLAPSSSLMAIWSSGDLASRPSARRVIVPPCQW